MFGIEKFKAYLEGGGESQDSGLPSGLRRLNVPADAEDAATKVPPKAKTLLSKTLAQHDMRFHKNGFKEGDTCNFREGLIRGDDADDLAREERKEGDVKLGLVKFTEEKDGTKKIMGIEEVATAVVEEPGDTKEGMAEDEDVSRYLRMVGMRPSSERGEGGPGVE